MKKNSLCLKDLKKIKALKCARNKPVQYFTKEYTQLNSKIGNLTRRRLAFEPGSAVAEAAKLKKFSDAGGFKSGGCPT